MINLIVATFYFLITTLIGYNYIDVSSLAQKNRITKLILAYLIGNGVGTYMWFILYRLGMKFSLLSLLIAAVLTWFFSILTKQIFLKKNTIQLTRKKEELTIWSLMLIIVVCILSVSAMVFALYQPISAWDALTMYDFRAMVIFQTGKLDDLFIVPYYIGYPLMTSLMHAAFYFMKASNPQIIYAVFYILLILLVYSIVKTFSGINRAILAMTLVSINTYLFIHASISYSNLPYTIYFYASLVTLVLTDRTGFTSNVLISAILMSLATWVRSAEPFWIIWLVVLCVKAIKFNRIRNVILPFLLAIGIRIDWGLFQHNIYEIMKYEFPTLIRINLWSIPKKIVEKVPEIIDYVWTYQIVPYSYWLFQFLNFKSMYQKYFLMIVVSSLALSIAGTAYLAITLPFWQEIGDSSTRMLYFLIPTIITSITIKIENKI